MNTINSTRQFLKNCQTGKIDFVHFETHTGYAIRRKTTMPIVLFNTKFIIKNDILGVDTKLSKQQ